MLVGAPRGRTPIDGATAVQAGGRCLTETGRRDTGAQPQRGAEHRACGATNAETIGRDPEAQDTFFGRKLTISVPELCSINIMLTQHNVDGA